MHEAMTAAVEKKSALERDLDTTMRRMASATKLINGLQGEKGRWGDQIAGYALQGERLVGDAVISSAFLAYAGPLSQALRSELAGVATRQLSADAVPFTPGVGVATLLEDDNVVARWHLYGLPADVRRGDRPRHPMLRDPHWAPPGSSPLRDGLAHRKRGEGVGGLQPGGLLADVMPGPHKICQPPPAEGSMA